MDSLEFLAAVLPKTGVYCAAEFSTSRKEHAFASTVVELGQHIKRFHEAGLNTYFALASFKEEGSRKADNALAIRALFMDIDCGEQKAYPTKKGAVEALDAFLKATGLPTPWVVDSGGGVHVYWPLTDDSGVPAWRLVAENLKRLCKQHGLAVDFTVTADTARVLRVPGTMNWKNPEAPREVKIRVIGTPQHHSLTYLAEKINETLLDPHTEGSGLFNVPGERLEKPTTPSLVKVLENRVTFFKTIMDRTVAGSGCGQLAYYMQNAKSDGMEPLWRGLLSLAKVCADGEKAAGFLSKMHPYSTARMNQKLREIKGPYPCSKLDGENPGVCQKCAHWGKITNPLALGHAVQTNNEATAVEIPAENPESPPVTVIRPTPPFGYAYGVKGGVYRQVKSEDAEGNEVTLNKLILSYDLFVVDILDGGEDGHLLQLMAMRPEGAISLTVPQRAVVSKDDTVKALAQQNILAAYGAGNDKYLFDYVRASAEAVSASKKAVWIPTAFGWQDDGTFVLNGRIFSATGEKPVPMPKFKNLIRITEPRGTLENWRRVVNLNISRKHYDVLAMMLIGFGSVIMKFSPFKSLTFHIGSSETGSGKSVSLQLAASIWGNQQYIINPNASEVAREHRMGSLNSLPLIIDEITQANKGDFEWLSTFVMNMSGGIGKERMKGAANEERDNFTTWQALMLLASNTHTTDFFSAVRQKISEGHLRRLLELKMDRVITWEWHEMQTLGLLTTNYGVAGEKFVRWIVANQGVAKSTFEKVYQRLMAEMNFTGDERFWIAGCASCITAGLLTSAKYADVVDFPLAPIIEVYKNMILEARDIVRTSKRSAEDILNSYTRQFFGNFVILKINNKTKQMETSFGDGGIIDKTTTHSHVKGRVEHGAVVGHISYYIEEQQMKAWCSGINYGYKDFRTQLEKTFVVSYCKKDLLSKTNGPQMRVNAIRILRPESPLDESNEPEVPVD